MMHAPTPPTIPYYSLFQEEPFKIRPSPPRQLLRGILVSKPCGHSKSTIVSNRTKPYRLMSNQSWFVRSPPWVDATTLIQIQPQNGNRCKKSSTPTRTCLNGKTTP